jgi:tRNA threonylcarbamoyladenosine biosynthesis protein TsaE
MSLMDVRALESEAERLAASVRAGDRFYLTGDLGTGKSTFARAFIRAMGVTGSIPSPSFVMDTVYSAGGLEVHHVDLYRLDAGSPALILLGLEEVLETADVVLVEWADRLPDLDSRDGVTIALEMTVDPEVREVSIRDRRMAGDRDHVR